MQILDINASMVFRKKMFPQTFHVQEQQTMTVKLQDQLHPIIKEDSSIKAAHMPYLTFLWCTVISQLESG